MLSSVRMAVGRTITTLGITMAVGTIAVGGASAVDGIIGAIGIAAAGGSGVNPARAYLCSS